MAHAKSKAELSLRHDYQPFFPLASTVSMVVFDSYLAVECERPLRYCTMVLGNRLLFNILLLFAHFDHCTLIPSLVPFGCVSFLPRSLLFHCSYAFFAQATVIYSRPASVGLGTLNWCGEKTRARTHCLRLHFPTLHAQACSRFHSLLFDVAYSEGMGSDASGRLSVVSWW